MLRDRSWGTIALVGLTLHPVLATAEVVTSASPDSPEVIQRGVPISPEISPSEAISTNTKHLVVETPDSPPTATSGTTPVTETAETLPITASQAQPLPPEDAGSDVIQMGVPITTEITPLEAVSMNASDVEVETSPLASPTPTPDDTQNASSQSLAKRSRLMGDWGGLRPQLEATGVTLNFEFTQFYQGLVSGTAAQIVKEGSQLKLVDESGGYGGRLDGFIDLDFGKLGLWKGGSLHSHLEYRFGPLPGALGGAFFPTNAGMAFPTGSPDSLVATSLYLSQKFGDRVSLLMGKFSIFDLVDDPFFGGWGIHRFWNTVFAAPPSGLVPPVFFGAIANVKLDPVTVSLWVYDPDDRTQEYWPEDLFGNGVTFLLKTAYTTKIAGRPTSFSLSGTYSTKTGTDFSSVSKSFRAGLEPLTKTGAYSIGFQFSHLFHQNPNNPEQGWGLFLKGSIADGNPNYIQNSIYGGIGGTGLFRGRELDSFGLGYFYYNLSDALQDSFNDLSQRASFGDVQGAELYYSYAVTPWLYITADLQYINPPLSSFKKAFIAGLRANIRL